MINVTMFVSPMGHDVNRVCTLVKSWMEETGVFSVTVTGTYPNADMSIENFMDDEKRIVETNLFFFICPDEHWGNPVHRQRLEKAVSDGAAVLFSHGLHPSYQNWEGAERMAGLLWRQTAQHGDFNYCDVTVRNKEHPITEGVTDFRTKEELFCALTNVWNVELETLVTAHSQKDLISRHGHAGTGNDEPVLTLGKFGNGTTVNFLLGHVWTYYTGHGLFENTMIAFHPKQVKTLLLRSCEFAVTGKVEHTKNV